MQFGEFIQQARMVCAAINSTIEDVSSAEIDATQNVGVHAKMLEKTQGKPLDWYVIMEKFCVILGINGLLMKSGLENNLDANLKYKVW